MNFISINKSPVEPGTAPTTRTLNCMDHDDQNFIAGAFIPQREARHEPVVTQAPGNQTDATDFTDTPASEIVETVLQRAVLRQASDIHIEPGEYALRIRLRQDGVLQTAFTLPTDKTAAVISRVKVMADLDIAEKRRPQDGRIRYTAISQNAKKQITNNKKNAKLQAANGTASTKYQTANNGKLQNTADSKTIDIRVSTLPTDFGEKVVMRLLDKESFGLSLQNLGFNRHELDKFKKAVQLPHGMVLVTGPTGSGKTTTLYSALNHINDPGLNIVTRTNGRSC